MTEEHSFLTREFKRYIWPLCKIHGFSRINGRTMWRFRDGMIDVVNLQGNGWNRSGEPQGFFINLGVYLPGADIEGGKTRPREYDCDLRGRLGSEWVVAADGADVEPVMVALQAAFEAEGWAWFHQFWTPEQTLLYIQTSEGGNVHGLGRLGSPSRERLLRDYARSLGREDVLDAAGRSSNDS